MVYSYSGIPSSYVKKGRQEPTITGYGKGRQEPAESSPDGQSWNNLSNTVVLCQIITQV